MIRLIFLVAGLGVLVGTLPAAAQGGGDRFVITEVEGGILRVDRQTGVVSLCKARGGDWTCELVPDDRKAMLGEIDQLRSENRQLRRGGPAVLPEPDRNFQYQGPPPSSGEEGVDDFTKEDVDKAMDTFEYMMDRLMGAAEKFRPVPQAPH